jgi:hypothetical protein
MVIWFTFCPTPISDCSAELDGGGGGRFLFLPKLRLAHSPKPSNSVFWLLFLFQMYRSHLGPFSGPKRSVVASSTKFSSGWFLLVLHAPWIFNLLFLFLFFGFCSLSERDFSTLRHLFFLVWKDLLEAISTILLYSLFIRLSV